MQSSVSGNNKKGGHLQEDSCLQDNDAKCRMCGSSDLHRKSVLNPVHKIFEGLHINSCPSCGLSWVVEELSDDVLRDYYSSEFDKFENRSESYPSPSDYFSDPKNMRKYGRAKDQVDLADQYLKVQPKRVLDFGAGLGTTLYAAKEKYPDAELVAVEADRNARAHLEYLGAQVKEDLFTLNEETFDVIYCSHVLEHISLHQVERVLAKLKALMANKGVLLLEVPHDNYIKHPELYAAYRGPHLIFFSTDALHLLLKKVGFREAFLSTIGKPHHKRQSEYLLRKFASKVSGGLISHYGADLKVIRAVLTL